MPAFLPAIPIDPRDGQPLSIKRFPDEVVLFAPRDSEAVEKKEVRQRQEDWPGTFFRLRALEVRGVQGKDAP